MTIEIVCKKEPSQNGINNYVKELIRLHEEYQKRKS